MAKRKAKEQQPDPVIEAVASAALSPEPEPATEAKPGKTATAAKKTPAMIELPELKLQEIEIRVVGETPLICNQFSERSLQKMLAKQMGEASNGREAKDPWRDYIHSLYWLDPVTSALIDTPDEATEEDVRKAVFGFPGAGFRNAAVTACTSLGRAIPKTLAMQAFDILDDFVIIRGEPRMRKDRVVNSGKTIDIRIRGEFRKWEASFKVRFNTNAISQNQLVNLIRYGGYAVGVGEWRKECMGNKGTFRVV